MHYPSSSGAGAEQLACTGSRDVRRLVACVKGIFAREEVSIGDNGCIRIDRDVSRGLIWE